MKEVFSKPVADKPKHKRTIMAEKRYQEAKAAADKGWSDEDHGNGKSLCALPWRALQIPLNNSRARPCAGNVKQLITTTSRSTRTPMRRCSPCFMPRGARLRRRLALQAAGQHDRT